MNKTQALDALGALSQETRLDVFRVLIQAGPDGLPAGAIARQLGVRQNTLSTHLANLAGAGLVVRTRDGRIIRYSAHYDQMRELLIYLLEDCCGGEAVICAPVAEAAACAC